MAKKHRGPATHLRQGAVWEEVKEIKGHLYRYQRMLLLEGGRWVRKSRYLGRVEGPVNPADALAQASAALSEAARLYAWAKEHGQGELLKAQGDSGSPAPGGKDSAPRRVSPRRAPRKSAGA